MGVLISCLEEEKRGGQSTLLFLLFFQVSLAQNNTYAKVTYFGVAHYATLHFRLLSLAWATMPHRSVAIGGLFHPCLLYSLLETLRGRKIGREGREVLVCVCVCVFTLSISCDFW